jgi:hypothetical protein
MKQDLNYLTEEQKDIFYSELERGINSIAPDLKLTNKKYFFKELNYSKNLHF